MKKISSKILASFFIVLVIVSIVPRTFFSMILPNFEPGELQDVVNSEIFFIGIIITATLTLVLFTLLINRIIVRRIRLLKNATQQVSKGNYERHIRVEGQDEISSLMQDFNSMSTALSQNDYLNRDFIRNFSHEMKTPLSSIRGYSELIEMGELSKEDTIKYAKVISNEAKRLADLGQSMLQLSLVESTTLFATDEDVDTSELTRQVLQVTQLDWEDKQLDIELELSAHPMKSNRSFIRQIIENLVTNAVRYSPAHGRIHITSELTSTQWVFVVTNEGPGIPPSDIDKVFQLFFVADRTRTTKSTGLGLAITKKMIDKLGGEITLTSVPNELTSFTVHIPIRTAVSTAH